MDPINTDFTHNEELAEPDNRKGKNLHFGFQNLKQPVDKIQNFEKIFSARLAQKLQKFLGVSSAENSNLSKISKTLLENINKGNYKNNLSFWEKLCAFFCSLFSGLTFEDSISCKELDKFLENIKNKSEFVLFLLDRSLQEQDPLDREALDFALVYSGCKVLSAGDFLFKLTDRAKKESDSEKKLCLKKIIESVLEQKKDMISGGMECLRNKAIPSQEFMLFVDDLSLVQGINITETKTNLLKDLKINLEEKLGFNPREVSGRIRNVISEHLIFGSNESETKDLMKFSDEKNYPLGEVSLVGAKRWQIENSSVGPLIKQEPLSALEDIFSNCLNDAVDTFLNGKVEKEGKNSSTNSDRPWTSFKSEWDKIPQKNKTVQAREVLLHKIMDARLATFSTDPWADIIKIAVNFMWNAIDKSVLENSTKSEILEIFNLGNENSSEYDFKVNKASAILGHLKNKQIPGDKGGVAELLGSVLEVRKLDHL